jgi:hypothetical protein
MGYKEPTADVNRGALMTYTSNETEKLQRAAVYVDKTLKGANRPNFALFPPTELVLCFLPIKLVLVLVEVF